MERGVVCGVTPIGLLAYFVKVFLLRWRVLSLTELTDLTEPICALFRSHRTPPAYRYHRGLTPSPSPNGEGSDYRDTPVRSVFEKNTFFIYQ